MDNRSFDQAPIQSDDLPADLQAIVNSYAAQPIPRPSSTETARLIRTLLVEAAFQAQDTHEKGNASLWRLAVLTRWRVFLLGPWFWMSGVLLLLVLPHSTALLLIPLLVHRPTADSSPPARLSRWHEPMPGALTTTSMPQNTSAGGR